MNWTIKLLCICRVKIETSCFAPNLILLGHVLSIAKCMMYFVASKSFLCNVTCDRVLLQVFLLPWRQTQKFFPSKAKD